MECEWVLRQFRFLRREIKSFFPDSVQCTKIQKLKWKVATSNLVYRNCSIHISCVSLILQQPIKSHQKITKKEKISASAKCTSVRCTCLLHRKKNFRVYVSHIFLFAKQKFYFLKKQQPKKTKISTYLIRHQFHLTWKKQNTFSWNTKAWKMEDPNKQSDCQRSRHKRQEKEHLNDKTSVIRCANLFTCSILSKGDRKVSFELVIPFHLKVHRW